MGEQNWIAEYAERVRTRMTTRLKAEALNTRATPDKLALLAAIAREELLAFTRAVDETLSPAAELSVRARVVDPQGRIHIECASNDERMRAVLIAGGFIAPSSEPEPAMSEDTFARALSDIVMSDEQADVVMRAFAALTREERSLFLVQAHAVASRMRGESGHETWICCAAVVALFSKWVDVLRDAEGLAVGQPPAPEPPANG